MCLCPGVDQNASNNMYTLERYKEGCSNKQKCKVTHRLLLKDKLHMCDVGTSICDIHHPAPPLQESNDNVFQQLFGIP